MMENNYMNVFLQNEFVYIYTIYISFTSNSTMRIKKTINKNP